MNTRTPAAVLANVMIAGLLPFFLQHAGGNQRLAEQAIIQAINAHVPRGDADSLAIVQLLATGLAAMDLLGRSIDETLSLPMTLRLRGNANSLLRASQAIREVRETIPPQRAQPEPQPEPEPSPELQSESEPAPAPRQAAAPLTEAERNRAIWADAFATVAAEFQAEMPSLSPEEQELAARRIQALHTTERDLRTPTPPTRNPAG